MVHAGRSRLAPLRTRVARAARGVADVVAPDDLEPRIVWIMGSPRTGSTWLLNMLALLVEGGGVVDEPLIGAHLAVPSAVITDRVEGTTDDLLSDLSSSRPDYFFSDAHSATWVPALRDLLLSRLGVAAPAGDRGPVLVKEPNGSLAAPMLLRCLPRSRLLFLVRDGRDVVDSMLDGMDGGWISDHLGVDVDQFGGRARLLEIRAHRWVRDVEAVQRAHDAHDPDRRLLLRYEDLLGNTVDELERVLVWLGLPPDRSRVADVVDQLDLSRVPPEQRGAGKFVRAATAGLWRDHMSDGEQAALAEIMGPTLRRLGYDD